MTRKRYENAMRKNRVEKSGKTSRFKVIVTQVPEPSVLSLLAVGLGGLVLRRRRNSHLAFCPDLGKRASCSL